MKAWYSCQCQWVLWLLVAVGSQTLHLAESFSLHNHQWSEIGIRTTSQSPRFYNGGLHTGHVPHGSLPQTCSSTRIPSISSSRRNVPLFSSSSTNRDSDSVSSSNQEQPKASYLILRIPIQIATVLLFYFWHLTYFTQHQIVFPVQLIPNAMGHFTGLGLDSVAGIVCLGLYQGIQRWQRKRNQQSSSKTDQKKVKVLPSLLSSPKAHETPWRLPKKSKRNQLTGLLAGFLLIQTYFVTGRFSLFWEDLLYNMSGLGFPITSPMYRSFVVLLGHLTWLVAGSCILKWIPRPPKFFSPETRSVRINQTAKRDKNNKPLFRWFRSSRNTNWVGWVIGGYLVSSCLFNLADLLNHYVLPTAVLEDAQESLVSQLVNPEHNDWLASLVGYIAPCITAPWWEEVLYRGFALPLLARFVGYPWAVFLQGVIFSAHHMSLTAALPLAVLGWVWAILYTKSQNLWVVILIHSMWNSRVFLGSWLGL